MGAHPLRHFFGQVPFIWTKMDLKKINAKHKEVNFPPSSMNYCILIYLTFVQQIGHEIVCKFEFISSNGYGCGEGDCYI